MGNRKYVVLDGKDVPKARAVWTDAFGEIPDGIVIHHIDGDWCNDDLLNLEAMELGDHTRLHISGVRYSEVVHGTVCGYSYWKCRCDECLDAAREYAKIRRMVNLGKEPSSHGLTGYINYGCRCDICRAAKRDYSRELRKKHKILGTENHGTTNSYFEYGCRCEKCKKAESDYRANYRRGE